MKQAQRELLFYSMIFLPIALYILATSAIFAEYQDPSIDSIPEGLLFIFKLFWFTGVIFAVVNLTGLIRWGEPHKYLREYEASYSWDLNKKLIIAFVSYGRNYQALKRSVSCAVKICENMGVNHRVEVVTDIPLKDQLLNPSVAYYIVPPSFTTKHATKFKARALQYLKEKRTPYSPENTWVLHLDEESVITPQVIAGISRFIAKYPERIGQGEIQYNAHNYGAHPLITAIDAVRTGDDLGRFRLQLKGFGKPYFGIHGSFLLIPLRHENTIGFDLGTKGSVTEDAYFALKAVDTGLKFGWVEGFIKEQSPFTVMDLIKQRRRWINGLFLLVFDKEISFSTRSLLMLNMFVWKLSWVGTFATVLNFAMGGSYFPLTLSYAASVIAGSIIAVYLIGLYRNLESSSLSLVMKLWVGLRSLVLFPLCPFVEAYAVIYAIARPVSGFYTVSKN